MVGGEGDYVNEEGRVGVWFVGEKRGRGAFDIWRDESLMDRYGVHECVL